MAELSIIVPIYNVERYLERCIESILVQTYTDFELILVNDGSPDRCAEIMEQYAQKDSRIVTIHQENKGVSAARNAGLKIAQGKYVGFVDPDDWIDEKMYKIMIEKLDETESDMACCNWDVYDEKMNRKEHGVQDIPTIMSNEEFLMHYFDLPRTVGGTVWNKLFLKKHITEMFDESMILGEDAVFSAHCCLNSNQVVYLNAAFYHNYERNNSATREKDEKLTLILNAKRELVRLSAQVNCQIKNHAEKDYLDSCLLYYLKYRKNKESQYYEMSKNHFVGYMKNNCLGVLCNKEIYWKTRMVYLLKMICSDF